MSFLRKMFGSKSQDAVLQNLLGLDVKAYQEFQSLDLEGQKQVLALNFEKQFAQWAEWKKNDSWPDETTRRYANLKFVDMNSVINNLE